jgi:hyperosmotically inducible periplasmic protein
MKTRTGLFVSSAALAGLFTVSIAGCNKPQELGATPSPATTVGTEIDDSVITARVKSAIVAAPEIKGFDFKVETRKGEVQLSGFVDSQSDIDRAMGIARAIAGVKSVDNKVSVKVSKATLGNTVDDGIVTTRVKAALLADANIRSSDIAVVTRKSEVQLSGYVDSQNQSDRAVEIVRGIEGVGKVKNEMSIKK